MSQSIYQYIRTKASNKLAFIDVDGTLTAHPWDTNEKDLLDKDLTNQAITELQRKGFTCILNTSRTAEMCMSETQYFLSKNNYGFSRPQPHMGMDKNKKRFYMKSEDCVPEKILDLSIIISASGSRIDVLQGNGGYAQDQSFYPPDFPDSTSWRKKITSFLATLSIPFSYSPIDSEMNYQNGITDIFPAEYRIQLAFATQTELSQLSEEIKKLDNVYFTDDSNPDKNMFMAYITPKKGKTDAVNHVISSFKIPLAEILIIGDSLPDLEAGLQINVNAETQVTILLVGGSWLSTKPLPAHHTRRIVLGDALFPEAIGPRSIVEFLK